MGLLHVSSSQSIQVFDSLLSVSTIPLFILVTDNDYIEIPGVIIHLNELNPDQEIPVSINNDNKLEPVEYLILNLELLGDVEEISISVNNISIIIVDDECEYIHIL